MRRRLSIILPILISLIAIIVTFTVPEIRCSLRLENCLPNSLNYTGRVLDERDLSPIIGVKVTLFTEDTPVTRYTDTEGVYQFNIDPNQVILTGIVKVDAEHYDIYERQIDISNRNIEDIRLIPIHSEITSGIPRRGRADQMVDEGIIKTDASTIETSLKAGDVWEIYYYLGLEESGGGRFSYWLVPHWDFRLESRRGMVYGDLSKWENLLPTENSQDPAEVSLLIITRLGDWISSSDRGTALNEMSAFSYQFLTKVGAISESDKDKVEQRVVNTLTLFENGISNNFQNISFSRCKNVEWVYAVLFNASPWSIYMYYYTSGNQNNFLLSAASASRKQEIFCDL